MHITVWALGWAVEVLKMERKLRLRKEMNSMLRKWEMNEDRGVGPEKCRKGKSEGKNCERRGEQAQVLQSWRSLRFAYWIKMLGDGAESNLVKAHIPNLEEGNFQPFKRWWVFPVMRLKKSKQLLISGAFLVMCLCVGVKTCLWGIYF